MKNNDKKDKKNKNKNKKNKSKFNDYTSFLNPEIVEATRRECIRVCLPICIITANLKNQSKTQTIYK